MSHVSRLLLVLAVGVGLLGAGAPAATASDIVERLRAVPGLTIVEEQEAPSPYRFFVLTYRQPADHARPWRSTFEQRLTLLHRSVERPMVLHSSGYDVPIQPTRSEPARLIDGNQISVEHRFFTPSRPEPTDWSHLNIWQAATDHHRIIAALRPIYTGRWISTGASKGGVASLYHRRFYPSDLDGTVAYVAPHNKIDDEDSAYTAFFERVGTDPACRAALNAMQREVLGPRRRELVDRYAAWAAANHQTFHRTIGTVDRAFEVLVLDARWGFWQFFGQSSCPDVPSPTATTDELYGFLDTVAGFGVYTDQGTDAFIPYYYQAGTQLGWPNPRFDYLQGVLRYPDIYEARSFVPRDIEMRFAPWPMLDVDRWVKQHGSELLFVYGENDPWGAEPFELGPGSRDSHWYEAAGANHGALIGQLTQDEQARATATVQRWAGLGSNVRQESTPAARRIPTLDDYNPGLERRRP